MPRENSSRYAIAATTPHAQATSTGTGDVKTLARPASAIAVYLTVTTNAARVVFDGSTPSSTNGILVPTGVLWLFEIGGSDIKFASSIAANSVVDALWLS